MTDEMIFATALEKADPAERAAYLDDACAGDTGRRQRLEGLLAAHARADRFLERPAAAPGGPDTGDTIAVDQEGRVPADDEEVGSLAFLAPPTRPDSLGRISHYEVLQVLGQGGFGIVFRAFDDVLHRVVAVKVLSPQMAATSPARKRFLREARSSAQVRHENVVQVYEVGEQPLPYIAMELIPGETLQQRLDRTGPLDVSDVLRIGRQVAEGLAAAHATELIHRDIKPGNLLLEGGNLRVKITDFGLARAADDASLTASGMVAGTPMYMAPEQAKGETLDQRADLFSLGSVLYQMVAGRPPFRANGTLAVLKRVAEDTPRPIREIIPETPQWLCDIIAKLHAKDPAERFQSARKVADLLAECEAELKVNARLRDYSQFPHPNEAKPAPVAPAAAGSRIWRWVAAVAVLVPLIALGVSATTWPSLRRALQGPAGDPAGIRPPDTANRFALQFDGVGSHVHFPTLRIDGLNAFTIETRVRWGGKPEKGTIAVGLGDPLFALDVEGTGAVVPYLMRNHQAASSFGARLGDSVWHDLAVTVAGHQVEVFIDGKRQVTRTPPPGPLGGNLTPPRDRFMLGTGLAWDVPAPIYPFRGEIAGLRISRVIRYQASYTPSSPLPGDADTLAVYHFDEGEGTVLKDRSGNGRDGTIVGAKWVRLSELVSTPSRDRAPATVGTGDDAEWKRIAALPAAEQIEAVRKELKRRNPEFDGTLTPTMEGDVVTGLEFFTDRITDIRPVRALPHLKALNCCGNGLQRGTLSDLTALKGMRLQTLTVSVTAVSDLSPLKGMPLTKLYSDNTPISDLTPLEGMALKELNCSYTNVASLTPLKGMPLTSLWCNHTAIADLSPIKGMPLECITIQATKVTDPSPLRGIPLTRIFLDFDSRRDGALLRSLTTLQSINDQSASEFLKNAGE